MAINKVSATKSFATIGTIGSAAHGKTMLVSALTKISVPDWGRTFKDYASLKAALATRTSRLGMSTIDVEYESEVRVYHHIDSPGRDCSKNMIIGAAPMDGAILVCSAKEDPTQQTREDIWRAYLAGVPYIVVFLNKTDLVDGEELTDQIETKVREMLSDCGYPGYDLPVVRGSALLAVENDIGRASIVRLMDEIDRYVEPPPVAADGAFLMQIENVEAALGGDTLLTGHIERGIVQPGDPVEVVGAYPTGEGTVMAVTVAEKSGDDGGAGKHVVLRVHGLKPGHVQRDQLVIRRGTIMSSSRFVATIYILSKDDGGSSTPLDTTTRRQFRFRSLDVAGSITSFDGAANPKPGSLASVEVTLDVPMPMEARQHFSIHQGDLTLAFGIVSEVGE